MFSGIDKFNIVYGSISYTPSTWCNLIPDIDNRNIARRSTITKQENVRESWTYYNATAKVKNLTASEIAFFGTISGKEITLTPNIDSPFILYTVSVTKAEIKYENDKFWKPYVDLVFNGVYDTEILCTSDLTLTLLTPSALTYLNGNTMNITWTSTNIPATEYVKIELYKNGVYVSTMTSSTLNSGSYNWIIAACLEGSDYQVKISAVRDASIYALSSSNFEIKYNGYYLAENNSDGNVAIKNTLTSLPDEYTFAFWYNGNGVARTLADRIITGIGGTGFAVTVDTTTLDYLAIINNSDKIRCSSWQMPTTAAWHSVIISIKHSTQTVAMYLNGVAGTTFIGTVSTTPPAFTNLQIFSTFTDARSYKLMGFWAGSFNGYDVAFFHAGNISAISKTKIAFWRMNEDNSLPYTDKTLDDSGNDYHGTPANVTDAFFNQYPEFDIDENGECITDENNEPIPIL